MQPQEQQPKALWEMQLLEGLPQFHLLRPQPALTGSFFGKSFIGGADGMLLFILAPGSFLCLGFLMALINRIRRK